MYIECDLSYRVEIEPLTCVGYKWELSPETENAEVIWVILHLKSSKAISSFMMSRVNGFIAQIFQLGSQCSSNARTDVIYMSRVNVLKRLMSCETTMVCLHCKTPIPTPILILIPVKCTKATMGLILIVIPMQSYDGN